MKTLVLAAILPIALLVGCDNEDASDLPRMIDALPVTAQRLFSDYRANEVAADAKYKDKWLAVTGQVDSVKKDILDNVFVSLRTQNRFMSAHAQMAKSNLGQVAQLKRGQEVMLLCAGGGLLLGSPVLDKCRIVEQNRTDSRKVVKKNEK